MTDDPKSQTSNSQVDTHLPPTSHPLSATANPSASETVRPSPNSTTWVSRSLFPSLNFPSLNFQSSDGMPISTGKRRVIHVTPTPSSIMHSHSHPPHSTVTSIVDNAMKTHFTFDDGRSGVSKRRRFILYTMAFATMLALSSVLDVRRASLRNRRSKLQLTLPSSSSLSSLSDTGATVDVPSSASGGAPNLDSSSSGMRRPVADDDSRTYDDDSGGRNSWNSNGMSEPVIEKPLDANSKRGDIQLSQQELDDGVDQLIAHVEQESLSEETNSSLSSGTTQSTRSDTAPTGASGNGSPAVTNGSLTTVNSTTGVDEIRLNAADQFNGAVKRLNDLLRDTRYKPFVDENDLRTLQALELQATRGDCELKSGASGGLFKSDAEAASGLDIERTHPLWGAWCLFMGSYKTDAMHDYVKKEQVLEQKVKAGVEMSTQGNLTQEAEAAPFDANAASLDDVMSPDLQSKLRGHAELVIDHLHDNSLRYLAALSLQATFGDCGPYGREKVVLKEGETRAELRKLQEPLLEQTVIRKEGALWGAWCVLQGKKRSTAATELSERVAILVDQLTKSQAASNDQAQVVSRSDVGHISSQTLDNSSFAEVKSQTEVTNDTRR